MHSNTIFPLESKYFAVGTTWFVEDDLLDEIDFSFAVLFLHKSFILDGFTRNMQDEKTKERYTLNKIPDEPESLLNGSKRQIGPSHDVLIPDMHCTSLDDIFTCFCQLT